MNDNAPPDTGPLDYIDSPQHEAEMKVRREEQKLEDIRANRRPAFDSFAWDQAFTDKSLPPKKLVQGLLLYRDVSLVAAQPNVGKSALAVDLGLCIAAGVPWHGREVDQRSVLYVAAESPESIKLRMMAAYHSHSEFKGLEGLPFYTTQEDVCLMGLLGMPTFKMKIEAWQRAHPDLGLVVVDTLRSACPGLQENDANGVSPIMQGLNELARSLNIHIMLVHHTTKSGEDYSGSGVIGAIVDAIIFVRNELEERGCIVAKVDKQRQLPCDKKEEFFYIIESAETGRGEDNFGDVETAAMVRQLTLEELEEIATEAKKHANESSVIEGKAFTESSKTTMMNKLVIFLQMKGGAGHLKQDILDFPAQIGVEASAHSRLMIKSVVKESCKKGGAVMEHGKGEDIILKVKIHSV
jgi:hypothetical protein